MTKRANQKIRPTNILRYQWRISYPYWLRRNRSQKGICPSDRRTMMPASLLNLPIDLSPYLILQNSRWAATNPFESSSHLAEDDRNFDFNAPFGYFRTTGFPKDSYVAKSLRGVSFESRPEARSYRSRLRRSAGCRCLRANRGAGHRLRYRSGAH